MSTIKGKSKIVTTPITPIRIYVEKGIPPEVSTDDPTYKEQLLLRVQEIEKENRELQDLIEKGTFSTVAINFTLDETLEESTRARGVGTTTQKSISAETTLTDEEVEQLQKPFTIANVQLTTKEGKTYPLSLTQKGSNDTVCIYAWDYSIYKFVLTIEGNKATFEIIEDSDIDVIREDVEKLKEEKQDNLTAGTGINITDTTISAEIKTITYNNVVYDLKGTGTVEIKGVDSYTKTETDTLLDDVKAKIKKSAHSQKIERDNLKYIYTWNLYDENGTLLSSDTIDFPLESVVMHAKYDNTKQAIIITLNNGETTDVPLGNLVKNLASEEYVNKLVTAEQKAREIADNNLQTQINTLQNDKQDKNDNTLKTEAKTVVGAINELFDSSSKVEIDKATIKKNAEDKLYATGDFTSLDSEVKANAFNVKDKVKISNTGAVTVNNDSGQAIFSTSNNQVTHNGEQRFYLGKPDNSQTGAFSISYPSSASDYEKLLEVVIFKSGETAPTNVAMLYNKDEDEYSTNAKEIVNVDYLNSVLTKKQDKEDNTLITTAKTVVGAINENATNIKTLSGALNVKVVAKKPDVPVNKSLYFVGDENTPYTIWLYSDNVWTEMGTVEPDLSEYYKKAYIDSTLVHSLTATIGTSTITIKALDKNSNVLSSVDIAFTNSISADVADTALATNLAVRTKATELQEKIDANTTAITTEVEDRKTADDNLQEQITTNKTNIETNATDIAELKKKVVTTLTNTFANDDETKDTLKTTLTLTDSTTIEGTAELPDKVTFLTTTQTLKNKTLDCKDDGNTIKEMPVTSLAKQTTDDKDKVILVGDDGAFKVADVRTPTIVTRLTNGSSLPTTRSDGTALMNFDRAIIAKGAVTPFDVGEFTIQTTSDYFLYNADDKTWDFYSQGTAIVDAIYPVYQLYYQFPSMKAPSEIFPNTTWIDVTADYNGRYFMASSTNDVGTLVDAGLPNIAGWLNGIMTDQETLGASGAFSVTGVPRTRAWGGTSGSDIRNLDFYASRSSSIYGKSSTVTPLTATMKIWQRTK